MDQNRITRVTEMEVRLNRVKAWLKTGAGDVAEDVRILDDYYHGAVWRSDLEADEAGELPADLPRVIGIARHSEDESPMVVYRALYGDGGLWVRPAAMWNEEITRDGTTCKRFTKV